MVLTAQPGTIPAVGVAFSNDAGTLQEIVSPANPLPTTATISGTVTADIDATATAAAPTYLEGTENPLSQNLTGDVRVIAKQSGSWTTTITPVSSGTLTATQVTVPATANGILILAANASRKGATISNPGTVSVYIQQAATGVTISNGFGIPPGQSYNIDEPLYTGAIYGIVASATQVVTVVELT